ncbi:MAG TPA: hypothetical protein VFB74_33215 [Kribbellaceae bacterium]|nr:hypothetical protein [Kribbellaceae bacterium]
MEDITQGWQLVGIGVEGDPVDIGGIDAWDAEWTAVERSPITVAHPSYPHDRHSMNIYEIRTVSPAVVFAAGEFPTGSGGSSCPFANREKNRPRGDAHPDTVYTPTAANP